MRILIIACVVALATVAKGESARDVMNKVSAGADAGNAIAEVLSDKRVTANIRNIAGKIGPFLGALGPAVALVTLFLPQAPSAELQFMKKKFAEMDAKFDRVFEQFGEVKNLIEKNSLKNQYGGYEQKIGGLSYRLRQMLEAQPNAVEGQKQNFIMSYEATYHNSAYNLWRGMMESNMALTDNIPKTAMRYTNNDRQQVQNLLKGVTQLIMQGVKVHLAYLKAVGRDHSYESEKQQWERKLKELISHIDSVDREVRNKYHSQSRTDILNLAANHKGASHSSFATTVYNFLNNKFFWRDWNVVIYNAVSGGDNHWVKVCSGHILFRKHGRNIVVASVDKSKSRINTSSARSLLNRVSTYTDDWWSGRKKRHAKDIFQNKLPSQMRNGCTYAAAGAIRDNAGVVYKAPSNRLAVVNRPWFKLHAFG